MKLLMITVSLLIVSFTSETATTTIETQPYSETIGSSFSLVNDTKEKVSIHTGSGFVSLNKGSKTSVSCNVGKEVRWANKGKKGDVIFKIASKHCGKTIKLSKLID
ncbi:hypothetical protein [Pontimicrobium sp. MEBiC01747]|jgi:hypothetical protein